MFGFAGSYTKDDDELTRAVRPQNRAIDGVNPREDGFAAARLSGVTAICAGPGSVESIGGTPMKKQAKVGGFLGLYIPSASLYKPSEGILEV